MTWQHWSTLALVWIVAAGLAFLAVRALEPAGSIRLVAALVAASGTVELSSYVQGSSWVGLAAVWCVCTVLDAAVCSELRRQRVPVLLVAPVVLFVVAIDGHDADWNSLGAGFAIFACFALASMRGEARARGFGDALLAGLTGLVLGIELGTMAVAAACFTAAGIALARKQRGPVAFAPYLALTSQLALLIQR